MQLSGITFRGPALSADVLPSNLPSGYMDLLRQINGFIAFDGGFHLRGLCDAPTWHSIARAWQGERSLHRFFPAVRDSDVPFGQDCLGDQFLLRGGVVHKLSAEVGEVADTGLTLHEFFDRLCADPDGFLRLHPLARFQREGGRLEPGKLLSAFPPYVAKESAEGVSLRAISADERIAFLAEMARHLSALPDGEQFRFVITK